MSIKLNTVAGTYAKRTLPLIGMIYSLFQTNETSIRNALKCVVHFVHYRKAKTLYLYDALERITVDHKFNGKSVAIKLSCFEDKTVQCDEYITLMFPSIDTVLEYELIVSKDQSVFREKYSDYLKQLFTRTANL